MARLVLVGLPGVGKTSVARALADRWGCESVDTDDLIGQAVGSSAPEYLRSEGEPAFRERELEAFERAVALDAVVATGGGLVTTTKGRSRLRGERTLWMDCADEVILERLGADDRPLLGEDHARSLARLRLEREDWYREVARARIDVAESIDVVIQRVIEELEQMDS